MGSREVGGTRTGSVGDKVPKPGDPVNCVSVSVGEANTGGTEVSGIGVSGCIVDGIGATVTGGTVAQPGALGECPCPGVGVASTGVPELVGSGVGSCTVAGIGPAVATGGVCKTGASLEGWVGIGVFNEDGIGVTGANKGSVVVEDVGTISVGDGVFGSCVLGEGA